MPPTADDGGREPRLGSRQHRLAVLALAFALTLTGCGRAGATDAAASDLVRIERPIDGYVLDVDVVMRIAQRQSESISTCLREQGVTERYRISGELRQFVEAQTHAHDTTSALWGVYDASPIDGHGYHLAPDLRPATEEGVSRSVDAELVSGCAAAAEAGTPGGHHWTQYPGLGYFPAGGPRPPYARDDVREAIGRWARCMRERGVRDYETPAEALNDPRWATKRPSPEEVRVAKADLACKIADDVMPTLVRAQVEADEEYLATNRERLQSLRHDLIRYADGVPR